MNHCQKEFSMENILFVTIMIEWQDYLMNNGYWNDELDNPLRREITCQYVENQERIILPKTVPISPIIHDIEMIKTKVDTDDDKKDIKYDKFSHSFEQLYCQYIERGKAPLELNISSDLRNSLQIRYQRMKNNGNTINEQLFWKIWYELTIVCNQVFDMLMPLLTRCYNDMKKPQ